jgi:hypothetical protein
MFYGSDLQHRAILDHAQATVTVTVLEDNNTECFQYDDDLNTFQFADMRSREIDMVVLKTCEDTLDCSAAVSNRCSARSCIGKPTERQCAMHRLSRKGYQFPDIQSKQWQNSLHRRGKENKPYKTKPSIPQFTRGFYTTYYELYGVGVVVLLKIYDSMARSKK